MTVLVTSSDVYKEQYGYNDSPSISVFEAGLVLGPSKDPLSKTIKRWGIIVYIRPLAIIFLLS